MDERPDLDYARNLFLLSFYTRGMAFADMAGLRRSDLKEGILCYVNAEAMRAAAPRWGGKRLFCRDAGVPDGRLSALGKGAGTAQSIACADGWDEKEALACSKKRDAVWNKERRRKRNSKESESCGRVQSGQGDGYLLPIVREGESHARSAYRNVQYKVNQGLKEIGRMLGLKMPLTMYVARHSWACLAKSKEVPLSVISDGLGHASERVTRIYLATLDMNAVDEVNRMIINGI